MNRCKWESEFPSKFGWKQKLIFDCDRIVYLEEMIKNMFSTNVEWKRVYPCGNCKFFPRLLEDIKKCLLDQKDEK